jgi:hypothetical protein
LPAPEEETIIVSQVESEVVEPDQVLLPEIESPTEPEPGPDLTPPLTAQPAEPPAIVEITKPEPTPDPASDTTPAERLPEESQAPSGWGEEAEPKPRPRDSAIILKSTPAKDTATDKKETSNLLQDWLADNE